MPLTVNMPQLGESVTEGTIARWLKHPGDPVAKYESIAEVITDKVNAEIPAPVDGVMAELIAPEGAVVAVGQPICSIETANASAATTVGAEEPRVLSSQEPLPAGSSGIAGGAASRDATPGSSPAEPEQQPVAPAAQAAAQTVPSVAPGPPSGNGAETYHLTPAVRMLAREHAVDLAQLQGSGLGGRITKKDVLEYVQQRDAGQGAAAPAPTPAAQPLPAQPASAAPQAPVAPKPAAAPSAPQFVAGEGDTVVPLTSMRRAIAEHMVRSKHTSPHAYLMVEVDMSAVSSVRSRARAEFDQRNGVNLTFLPFVGRCVCEALRRYPTLNASWSDEGVVLHRDINLGIAVALEDNLIVPVIHNADRLSISGLALTMADLGERARSNHLKLDEIQGGTFTLNNTGALGAVMTQAIINQPQAAIMTMDLIVKRAVVVNDAIAIRPMMNLGLSFDHRVNDGLAATRFVRAVKDLLEGFDASTALL
jgi:2-oxoisovalerate dehydrogenase E2 component (dihydrolipoyl transacylase)